ncbi:MFS transporter [Paenibacillus woosongensis]|uniref:MFS transporter n=1 Tax=Paenibacillus woosongensis TaxID=307580 RepID=A0A7X2YYR4_9BACL|nr:MFS transporter [Paenibacillus woosongensis]MUG43646.1 MFS transporter [Paenibacillus woosongensis]
MKSQHLARSEVSWLRALIFTIYGTSALVASYFPLFYADLGFSRTQIGYIYAVGPMISLISNLLWSYASDRFRTIKKILLILLTGQLLMSFFLSMTTKFAVIMIIITLYYSFFYPVLPLSDSIAISTANRHKKNFVSIRIFGSIGFAIFALLIGYVLSTIPSVTTMGVSMIIAGTALFLTLFVKDQATSVARVNFSGVLSILKQKELLWFLGCVFCLALGMRMNDAFLSISLHDLGAGQELVGWAMLLSAFSEIPIFLLLTKYGAKFKELPLLLLASLMFALRFMLVGISDSATSILLIQLMHGVSFGIFYVTAIRMLSRLIPAQFQATGLALFTVMWSSLSGLCSGAFGGMVFEHFGRENFYFAAMGTSLLAFIGFASRYFYRPKAKVHSSHSAAHHDL